jgi:uncharacterized glyoxalase superfamily protein PhnB
VTQSVFPTLRYRDAKAAIRWLEETLGFTELAVHQGDDDRIEHAELEIAGDVVMIGSLRDDDAFATARNVTYIAVDDVDARYERAREAGAEVPDQIAEQDYGSREFHVTDPEGNVWSFGTYRPQPPA